MNVLIIPEDFRKDQHVLKPILSKMLAAAGKPKANIDVSDKSSRHTPCAVRDSEICREIRPTAHGMCLLL